MDLGHLSKVQRKYGLEKGDKNIYDQGVKNGLTVFNNRNSHLRLMFELAGDLVNELSRFKSTPEQEVLGVQILKKEYDENPHNFLIKFMFSEYLIRKGSIEEAKMALKMMETLNTERKELTLKIRYSFIRFYLRFAKQESDLNKIEEELRQIPVVENQSTNGLSLLKALWQSHPLNRSQSEWFILAARDFKKAFENVQSDHVQFLLDNLTRYDKLKEEEQLHCRELIAGLLGLGLS